MYKIYKCKWRGWGRGRGRSKDYKPVCCSGLDRSKEQSEQEILRHRAFSANQSFRGILRLACRKHILNPGGGERVGLSGLSSAGECKICDG